MKKTNLKNQLKN